MAKILIIKIIKNKGIKTILKVIRYVINTK
jgi:hypothetical protein